MTEGVPRLDRPLKIGGVALMAAVVVAARFFWGTPPKLFGVSAEFILFGLILLGVALVGCVSMMPVNELPLASWQMAFGMGFVSSIFDNIPLTKLALDQGVVDWGVLAYAVGFGGSIMWFGSSAGVAVSNIYTTREERPGLAVERMARAHCLRVRVLRATGGGLLDSSVAAEVTAVGDPIRRFDVRDPAFSPLRSA